VAAPHRSDRLYRVLPADLHDVDPMAAAMLTDDMMEAAKVDGAPSSSLHLWVGARHAPLQRARFFAVDATHRLHSDGDNSLGYC